MPLVATRGAASSQGFGEFAQTTAPVYIEDVFSTYLIPGSNSTVVVNNGINLSGKGGLVWQKDRAGAGNHYLEDTARGAANALYSNLTNAQAVGGGLLVSGGFSSNGFTTYVENGSSGNQVSWTFREQPKFFDIVTYTGNGAEGRAISHNLGSTPGCIIVKTSSNIKNWAVWHRAANGGNAYAYLNDTTGFNNNGGAFWGSGGSYVAPTATNFTVSSGDEVNKNGWVYVAYVFAHDAGGFGLTGSDNVISCGSFTKSTATTTVTLGYEPQWVLFKRTNSTGDWILFDTMRGLTVTQADRGLYPNLSIAEDNSAGMIPTATGFDVTNYWGQSNETYIYIAIRRGPMKTPTTGTQVFYSGSIPAAGSVTWSSNVLTDFVVPCELTGAAYNFYSSDRLRGARYLQTSSSGPEPGASVAFDVQNGLRTTSSWYTNGNFAWFFRRFPGVFDIVCYTGNGGGIFTYVNHNLGVKPEFMIIKNRSNGGTVNQSWWVSHKDIFYNGLLNSTDAFNTYAYNGNVENSTSTQIAVSFVGTNASGENFVAYLFATVAGVSKVGSYTGTGALQTVNCGFTTGARFIMIKRTDAVGDWWIYDSSRGISSGNDPYIYWNNATAAEVTNTNYVDTTSVGFQVTAAAPAGLNANGGTYIFLAIA